MEKLLATEGMLAGALRASSRSKVTFGRLVAGLVLLPVLAACSDGSD